MVRMVKSTGFGCSKRLLLLPTSSEWLLLPPSLSERLGSVLSRLYTSLPVPAGTYYLKSPIPQFPGPLSGTPVNTTSSGWTCQQSDKHDNRL